MKDFSKVNFKWTFRDYQQKVLDNSEAHLKDKRIHIVAAPGSGKTILGLELIRRLGAPALVMSPSVSIKQQWGERFVEAYLPETENADEYISYSLKEPRLLTSVTYQALHAAFSKIVLEKTEDEDELESEVSQDFSDFDLIGVVRRAGIKTICLDEAHHLKSEWQRALERFIEAIGFDITIISLTATPPYDSAPAEWNRYIRLCGEIDEEIFVPQLVKQKTLCPHQDYIYFSYPTDEEAEMVRSYKLKAQECVKNILSDGYITAALRESGVIGGNPLNEEFILENTADFAALLTVASSTGVKIPDNVISKVFGKKNIPECKAETVQTAFQLVIDNPEIFGEAVSGEIRKVLSESSLIEKRKVCLIINDKLNKMLASSMGKLKSIESITESEIQNLGDGLRMLILTDFIKKDVMKTVGTADEIHTMGAVPVFEAVRRKCGEKAKVALLTGSLVILPDMAVACAQKIANEERVGCIVKPIENTSHSEIVFSGSNKHKVGIITRVFAEGFINVLVGTKSLLGEGWDSPNINSLILASFVGSFMLSNQMRGRAIRIDKKNPEKVSDIWHLVTVLPDEQNADSETIAGDDFDTVKRRFSCFQAPAYNEDVIENGIKRIDILTPPFNNAGIDRINNEMLRLAAGRDTVAARWDAVVRGSARPEISETAEIPATVYPGKTVFRNKLYAVILAVITVLGIVLIAASSAIGGIAGFIISAVAFVFCMKKASFVVKNSSVEKTVTGLSRAVLKTLQQLKLVESSPKVKLNVSLSSDGKNVCVSLTGAPERDKKVFLKAIGELLSPIDDPRYVIVGIKKLFNSPVRDYVNSFACPAAFGVNKESAELFGKNLKSPAGNFELVYTRSENGRKILNECKKLSRLQK